MFISNWIRERKIRKIAEQVMLSQLHEYRNASAYHRESMVESWLKSYGPGHNAYQCMAKQSLETAKQVLKSLDEEIKKDAINE